ncbi:MAG: hypothetical protein NVV63_16060 [Opitutus sp.]|nr:hypothetical protein [Opitutus sp.]
MRKATQPHGRRRPRSREHRAPPRPHLANRHATALRACVPSRRGNRAQRAYRRHQGRPHQARKLPPAPDLPEQPIPAEFDYDRWLGPTPWRPYHEQRVLGDYGAGWRRFTEYGGRKNGDWGAHHFDIIQWALGMDQSGPVEFIPKGYEGTEFQTHVYANGVRVERVGDDLKAMIEFTGTKGKVWVSRDDYLETDPPELATRPVRADEIHLYVSDNHHTDFFNCVRTRQHPIADVEIGHRSATVGHLNNIAAAVGRPIRWDPSTETIVGDAVASTMLDRPRRAPYGLL